MRKPVVAFILSLVSGLLSVVPSVMAILLLIVDRERASSSLAVYTVWGSLIELVAGILILVGAFMIYTGKPSNVEVGSVQVLITSIMGIFLCMLIFATITLSFILGLIGGILGLVWKPSESKQQLQPS